MPGRGSHSQQQRKNSRLDSQTYSGRSSAGPDHAHDALLDAGAGEHAVMQGEGLKSSTLTAAGPSHGRAGGRDVR